MIGKAGQRIGATLRIHPDGENVLLDGQLAITRDKQGLAMVKDIVAALSAITSPTTPSGGDQSKTQAITAFPPFADDTSALSLSGISVENHPGRIDLWGQAVVARNGKPTAEVLALLALSSAIQAVLEAAELPDSLDAGVLNDTTTVRNPFL
jgi:hypothetical protein